MKKPEGIPGGATHLPTVVAHKVSAAEMVLAAYGALPPIGGAVAHELLDLAAVLNAVRVALPFGTLRDF